METYMVPHVWQVELGQIKGQNVPQGLYKELQATKKF